MKALHFGAGNIGRGFIGQLLFQSGYEIVFADVVPDLVDTLNIQHAYRVIVLGENEQEIAVQGVRAVNLHSPACAQEIRDADLITTAVGIRNFDGVADSIAAGLAERARQGVTTPINILACENAINATDTLKELVIERLAPDVKEFVHQYVGFANVAVDRIAPNVKRVSAQPLDAVVEEFFEWDIEKTTLRDAPDIAGATFVDELGPYLERKLFLLNGAHAAVAYMGYLKGARTIYEAMQDEWTAKVVRGMQKEATLGLLHAYPQLGVQQLEAYSETILQRFLNPHLEDDVVRVGRDPMRKLGARDRLISPLRRCLQAGEKPVYLPIGIAAGYRFCAPEDDRAVALQGLIAGQGIVAAIREVSGDLEEDVIEAIVAQYQQLSK